MMNLRLSSSAFESGGDIPMKYTCDGNDVSPPLEWNGAPDGTQSFVLICDDPDAPRGTWSHWVIYNIPPNVSQLPEGAKAPGAAEGRNDFGNTGYGGPCPPRGPAHRYYFRLYALDTTLDLPPGATRQQALDRIQNHIVAQAELMGRYARR
jgi:Raf kinase inhibitor-like YbhB/YbcL family protein